MQATNDIDLLCGWYWSCPVNWQQTPKTYWLGPLLQIDNVTRCLIEKCIGRILWHNQRWITSAINGLQKRFGCHCVEKLKGFIFMHNALWLLRSAILRFLQIMQMYHVFSTVEKFFLRSDVTKVKLRKECKIDFRVFKCILLWIINAYF